MNRRDSGPLPAALWVDGVVRSLIQRAAHSAPPALSQRLEEEWLADLAARRGAIPRLRFALGCSWATRVIGRELGTPARTAATATGHNTVAVCVQTAPRFNSRRTTVVLLIAAVHGLVIYGLATGMARGILAVITPIELAPFSAATPRIEPPPPLGDPQLTQFHPEVSSPPIAIDLPPPQPLSDHLASIPDIDGRSAPVQSPPPQPVNRIVGGPGAGFPHTDDFYPDSAVRLGEQGVATIQVCVDNAGRLTADPSVVQSSGSVRLDQGALRLAQAGSGHYRATTEDGRPVSSCYPFRVRFDLKYRLH